MTHLLSWIHFKYSLKGQEASNRLREDNALGNSGDRALCSNCWTVRGTLIQNILDNSELHKFKLGTQLKTLNHIVDEKQVGIKDAITIISSLNASQKLLVSQVLKPVKLILTLPTSNTVSERSCSTLHRFNFTCGHL